MHSLRCGILMYACAVICFHFQSRLPSILTQLPLSSQLQIPHPFLSTTSTSKHSLPISTTMPYVLGHPLPAPYGAFYMNMSMLPTFTTSSRQIARFFHSQGWRVLHVSLEYDDSAPASESSWSSATTVAEVGPSAADHDTPSPSSSSSPPANARSSPASAPPNANPLSMHPIIAAAAHAPLDHFPPRCCLAHPSSSIAACGPCVELHSYLLPIDCAIFFGPQASSLQLRYFRHYAWWGGIEILDERGNVDLWAVNAWAVWKRDQEAKREREGQTLEGEKKRVKRRTWKALEGRMGERWGGGGIESQGRRRKSWKVETGLLWSGNF
jgi:hypothetical protein